MKLIEKNSKDELVPFRETIDSWLLILVGEDPRPIHRKIQENGEKSPLPSTNTTITGQTITYGSRNG